MGLNLKASHLKPGRDILFMGENETS